MSFLHQISDLLLSPRFKNPATLTETVSARYNQAEDLAYYKKIALLGFYEHEEAILPLLPKGHALVVGVGAGREAFALETKGFAVDGMDSLATMIEMAEGIKKERSSLANFFHKIPDHKYSLIWITANLTSHIPSRAARLKFFTELKYHLAENGVILLKPDIMRLLPPSRFWIASQILRIRSLLHGGWWEKGDTARGYLGYSSRGLLYYHYFSEREVKEEITAAGLSFALAPHGFWLLTANKTTQKAH